MLNLTSTCCVSYQFMYCVVGVCCTKYMAHLLQPYIHWQKSLFCVSSSLCVICICGESPLVTWPSCLKHTPDADGDNQLIESNVVSEYLDVQYKSTGTKLFPEDPLQLAKVTLHPTIRSQLLVSTSAVSCTMIAIVISDLAQQQVFHGNSVCHSASSSNQHAYCGAPSSIQSMHANSVTSISIDQFKTLQTSLSGETRLAAHTPQKGMRNDSYH